MNNQLTKSIVMRKLIMGLFLSSGLIVSSAYALDFGKMLGEVAKQKVDEVIQGDEKPTEAPVTAPPLQKPMLM